LTKKSFLDVSTFDALLFCKLFKTGNTTETAKQLDIKTSQVRVGIRRLEEKLGISPLFIRNRRQGKFVPTAIAEKLEQNMQAIIQFALNMSNIQGKERGHVSIKSTHSVLEYFLGPYVASFIEENPTIRISFKQDDDLKSMNNSLNEILITCFIEDDNLYQYIPFHTFRQKLWASPDYIDKYGNPTSVEELKSHRLLMRKNIDDPRALFGSTLIKSRINNDDEFAIYDVYGTRFIDFLCETGCGIMASSEESIRLGKMKLEQVYKEFKGDDFPLYVCVSKDFLKTDVGKNVTNWIFKSRNMAFRGVNLEPSEPFTPLK